MRGLGFTLIEVLIGTVLFLAVGLLVLSLLLWGMDASLDGQAQQHAQQDARSVVEAIRADVSMGVIPPLATGAGILGNGLLVPSGVMVPSGYATPPGGDIYTQSEPSASPTSMASQDIVAVVLPNQSASNFIPTLMVDQNGTSEFSLVVYYVTDSTGQDVTQFQQTDVNGNPVPSSAMGVSAANPAPGRSQAVEGGHIVWRNVYMVSSTGAPLVQDLTGQWTVDFTQLNGPNGQAVNTGATSSDPTVHDSMVSLPAGDAVQFFVSHAVTQGSTGDFQTYHTVADRHNFGLDAFAVHQVHTHLGQAHFKAASLTESVTCRAFQ